MPRLEELLLSSAGCSRVGTSTRADGKVFRLVSHRFSVPVAMAVAVAACCPDVDQNSVWSLGSCTSVSGLLPLCHIGPVTWTWQGERHLHANSGRREEAE